MSGLAKDDIIRMANEAWGEPVGKPWAETTLLPLERFATLVAAAEREKVAQWMVKRGYATGHGDTTEDLLQELDWQIADGWNRALMNGVKTEREACAQICDALKNPIDDPLAPVGQYESGGYITAEFLADAIRARGNDAA